ncbi:MULTISPECIES: glycosyltransferase family 4 protein [Pectobacterium]|uniref:glycosyltransferase family 4 protein n=1 Tax=Pectobacterium TaxID=122277 RepID=UPI0010FE3B19|nr:MULTISPECIES: glycosyltransferase family 1 protein [Pectobacterium]KAA3667410.1 glycosyltransferase family 4 protein [Pectobacterium carotovorum subsp. carotovorum]MCA6925181.1 glycosyltransferase family 4 protein [Pectobacterium versatile]MCH5081941.1 glycosyltransferase family 4 protein [Pectobacterium versatile]
MINVAFIPPQDRSWLGGVNYYQKIIHIIDKNPDEFRAFLFVGNKIDEEVLELYKSHKNVIIVRHSIFDRLSIIWLSNKILSIFLGDSFILKRILNLYNIDVLSHAVVSNFKSTRIKYIPWIPDLQHLYLPQFFSKKEWKKRERAFKRVFKSCDKILVSSFSAKQDLLDNYAVDPENVEVLHFTSSPEISDILAISELVDKYAIPEKYIYIPNQFWAHKNHKVAFDAIRILKSKGSSIHLVCTGNTKDSRNDGYFSRLVDDISDISDHISILGTVPYRDVVSLMVHSECVLNPSLFEGWSTSVEECKAVGKKMILSNITLHQEQYPDAYFFDKESAGSLADVIANMESNPKVSSYQYNHQNAVNEFSSNYRKILLELVG